MKPEVYEDYKIEGYFWGVDTNGAGWSSMMVLSKDAAIFESAPPVLLGFWINFALFRDDWIAFSYGVFGCSVCLIA